MESGSSFERLFSELKGPIFSYVHSILRSRPDSEEILQETFLALYQQLVKKPDLESPKAWTYRVAGNLCFSRLRRQRKLAGIMRFLLPTPGRELPNEQADSEERMIRSEEADILDRLIAALPPRHRAILILFRDGYSYSQIAAMTRSRISTVGVTIKRAVERFEQQVRPMQGE